MRDVEKFISLTNQQRDYITALKVIYSKHVDPELAASLQARVGQNREVKRILGTNQIKLKQTMK